MYYSVCYINILITMFLTTFRRFLTTFRRFPKIFQNCSEGLTNVSEHFTNIFWRLPKIAEGSRRFPRKCDDVSIIQHRLWVLFKRLCSYSNGNLKTCDNNLIFSHVNYRNFTCENIWIFSAAEILIKHWCLYNKEKIILTNQQFYIASKRQSPRQ